MAIGTTAAIIAGGAALAGGIAGAIPKKETTSNQSTTTSSSTSSVNAGTATAQEQAAGGAISSNFSQLQDFSNLGPGASDVSAGVGASRDLASLLQQYQQSGGAPSAQDIQQGQSFAGQMFAGQRLGAQQASLEAQQQYAQQAAIQGRGGLDPIFRNKVAQEQQRAEAMIGAQQNAFGAQQAQQFSQNRLGFASQRANVLGGLATQALSNRQALVGMGSQIEAAERNFRLQTATRSQSGTQDTSGTSTKESGGGVGGAISGALGGLGSGLGIASGIGAMPSMGAGGAMGAGGGAAPSLGNYGQGPANNFFNLGK
jgi:hypothetical protein